MNNKFGAKKTYYLGALFDSKAEARRYGELLLLERAGKITDLQRQVPFELIPVQRAPSSYTFKRGANKGMPKPGKVIESAVHYYADFVYKKDGKTVVEDVKGTKTKDYVIKRKLMLLIHGIKILEVS